MEGYKEILKVIDIKDTYNINFLDEDTVIE